VLDVKYQWQKLADFKKRDYCVQYAKRFQLRLPGNGRRSIHYYFKHSSRGITMVADFPGHSTIFDDGGGSVTSIVYTRARVRPSEAGTDL